MIPTPRFRKLDHEALTGDRRMPKFSWILISLLFATPLRAESEPTLWKTVDAWAVFFHPDLPGCGASIFYEDGTGFFIGFAPSETGLSLRLALQNDKWVFIENGARYAVTARFGNKSPWPMDMIGQNFLRSPGFVRDFDIARDGTSLLAEEFQRENDMLWSFPNAPLGHFSLAGSHAAFQTVMECQTSLGAALDDMFKADPVRAPAALRP